MTKCCIVAAPPVASITSLIENYMSLSQWQKAGLGWIFWLRLPRPKGCCSSDIMLLLFWLYIGTIGEKWQSQPYFCIQNSNFQPKPLQKTWIWTVMELHWSLCHVTLSECRWCASEINHHFETYTICVALLFWRPSQNFVIVCYLQNKGDVMELHCSLYHVRLSECRWCASEINRHFETYTICVALLFWHHRPHKPIEMKAVEAQ